MKANLSFAACCVLGCLLVFTTPASISAEPTAGQRQLLVVGHDPNADVADAKDPNTTHVTSGSASSSVGEGVDIPVVQKTNGPMEPAQPPSRRKQLKRQQQVLGRKGMPSVRQASQDDLLPFCDPTDGVVCADIDKYGLLKAGAAGISLSDTFPFFRVRPFGSWEGTSKSTVDLLNDIVEDSTAGKLSTGLDLSVFDEQLNSTTDATSTLASAALNLGPKSSLKVAGDKTDVKGSFVWNTLKPVFNVVNGLPIGLQTVKDGRN